jgi:hypothetical protein
MNEVKKCPICDSNIFDGECATCGYNEDMNPNEIEDHRQNWEDNIGCDYDWENEDKILDIDTQDIYDIEYDR